MNWLSWAVVPLTVVAVWLFSASVSSTLPTLRGKRILLLIAHPDDEAMFFSPTVLSLAQPHLGNHIKILCLSTGNATGLGTVRRRELVKSALLLGLRTEQDVLVLDDERFEDSMTKSWDAGAISSLLQTTFAPEVAKAKKAGEAKANIDVLITFDERGVSNHPNHISLHRGAKVFVKDIEKGRSGWQPLVKLYVLPTVGMLKKYASVFDIPATLLASLMRPKQAGDYPDPLVFVNGPVAYRQAQLAMTEAHQSQMLWFRWGWIGISRYMVVNHLQKIKVT